jgi:hypothetical protein
MLQNINGLNKFVAELHSDILQGLKVKLPKDLKTNLVILRKMAGLKMDSRSASFSELSKLTSPKMSG